MAWVLFNFYSVLPISAGHDFEIAWVFNILSFLSFILTKQVPRWPREYASVFNLIRDFTRLLEILKWNAFCLFSQSSKTKFWPGINQVPNSGHDLTRLSRNSLSNVLTSATMTLKLCHLANNHLFLIFSSIIPSHLQPQLFHSSLVFLLPNYHDILKTTLLEYWFPILTSLKT